MRERGEKRGRERKKERERVCVCVCERERERENAQIYATEPETDRKEKNWFIFPTTKMDTDQNCPQIPVSFSSSQHVNVYFAQVYKVTRGQ